jgi:hypothetical protein
LFDASGDCAAAVIARMLNAETLNTRIAEVVDFMLLL